MHVHLLTQLNEFVSFNGIKCFSIVFILDYKLYIYNHKLFTLANPIGLPTNTNLTYNILAIIKSELLVIIFCGMNIINYFLFCSSDNV